MRPPRSFDWKSQAGLAANGEVEDPEEMVQATVSDLNVGALALEDVAEQLVAGIDLMAEADNRLRVTQVSV